MPVQPINNMDFNKGRWGRSPPAEVTMTTSNDPTGEWMKQSFRDTEDPSILALIQKKLLFSVNQGHFD